MLQVGVVAATDSILAAIQKLNGNTALKMDAVTAANYKAGVTAAGVANGINLVFTLPNTPVASTEMIFVNGVLQQRGAGNDYYWGYSYFRGWKLTAHCFKCNCNLFRIII
jgi:hypothetical protein